MNVWLFVHADTWLTKLCQVRTIVLFILGEHLILSLKFEFAPFDSFNRNQTWMHFLGIKIFAKQRRFNTSLSSYILIHIIPFISEHIMGFHRLFVALNSLVLMFLFWKSSPDQRTRCHCCLAQWTATDLSYRLIKLSYCDFYCDTAGRADSSSISSCASPTRWRWTCTNVSATASTGRWSSITQPATENLMKTLTVRAVFKTET